MEKSPITFESCWHPISDHLAIPLDTDVRVTHDRFEYFPFWPSIDIIGQVSLFPPMVAINQYVDMQVEATILYRKGSTQQ